MDHTLQSSGTVLAVVFPVYDAHGNNVATLSRNGLGYLISNRRSFDAWGSVRLGSQTGDPTGRYCANLGHKQDDESGLIYMRARYYEPGSGRFVSQDPARDGDSWYTYARNNPVESVDAAGQSASQLLLKAVDLLALLVGASQGVADGLGLERRLKALLNTLGGMIDAAWFTIKVIQSASTMDRRSPAVNALMLQGFASIKLVSILVAVQNLRWYILLNSDPEAECPSWFS